MAPWRDAPDLESAALVPTTAAAAGVAEIAEPPSGAVGSQDKAEEEQGKKEKAKEEKKGEKEKEKVDPEFANARARAAQAAECGVVGVHCSTEVVQSEVGCLKLWRDRGHTLLLHKDCVCEMIKQNVSTVILMPEQRAGTGKEFPECQGGDIPVALRIPKDDTEVKEKKEKKEKKLKYPKYAFFKARSNWPVKVGLTVAVEGVHLGWTLRSTGPMPSGCRLADDERGLPEPLEMLTVEDVRNAKGDPQDRDFVCVSLRQRRSATWKIANFLVRTVVELIVVHLFMVFIGSEPNNYVSVPGKPWDTTSDNSFVIPGLFQKPYTWRGPGMEPIWYLYMGTFVSFLYLKLLIALLWMFLPVVGKSMKYARHFLAALYPIAVSLPLVMYLVYLTAAVVACRECSTWHCGVYAHKDNHLQLDIDAFRENGGCDMADAFQLPKFHQYVLPTHKLLTEHEHCSFNDNSIFDALGISLDSSRREGTCEPRVDESRAKDEAIMKEMESVCGHGFWSVSVSRKYQVQPEDRDDMPWTMFARHLPINNDGNCSSTGEGFENGPYIYYEPDAGHKGSGDPQGAICACRSARGSRDCYRRVEGAVDRCKFFTGVPEAYGGLLQYDSVPSVSGSLGAFLTIIVPVFALFTIKAWDDIPLAGVDKFDIRLQSRMKLDVLDFFVFFYTSALFKGSGDPLVKFILPDTTWHDFELFVFCIAWASAFVWWSVTIFCRAFDTDPDKTPKMWKNVGEILGNAERSAAALEQSRFQDPYRTALKKQSILYEKELQKVIKKRTVVDILAEGIDIDAARWRHWRRCIIVFSSPKVKDLRPEDLEKEGGGAFTLYVAGGWPWSKQPPENVWKAESWEEYIAHEPDATVDDVPPTLRKIMIPFDEMLIRVQPASAYMWFDPRYLGWCYPCGCQPRSEYKKMKEEDHRISASHRTSGYSETYYNKIRFDYFERNMEMISAVRSLFVDLLFLVARLGRGLWGGGFGSNVKMLLIMKNVIFSLFGIVYIFTCGNTRQTCGPCRASPSELLAKCIERTKIGNAIKLSMLMPLRICIESTSCGFRLSAETRQQYLTQRFHLLLLRRDRASSDADTTEIDHEIRLLVGQVDEYSDLIEMMETKNIVRMRARLRAKDLL